MGEAEGRGLTMEGRVEPNRYTRDGDVGLSTSTANATKEYEQQVQHMQQKDKTTLEVCVSLHGSAERPVSHFPPLAASRSSTSLLVIAPAHPPDSHYLPLPLADNRSILPFPPLTLGLRRSTSCTSATSTWTWPTACTPSTTSTTRCSVPRSTSLSRPYPRQRTARCLPR